MVFNNSLHALTENHHSSTQHVFHCSDFMKDVQYRYMITYFIFLASALTDSSRFDRPKPNVRSVRMHWNSCTNCSNNVMRNFQGFFSFQKQNNHFTATTDINVQASPQQHSLVTRIHSLIYTPACANIYIQYGDWQWRLFAGERSYSAPIPHQMSATASRSSLYRISDISASSSCESIAGLQKSMLLVYGGVFIQLHFLLELCESKPDTSNNTGVDIWRYNSFHSTVTMSDRYDQFTSVRYHIH